MTQSEWDSWAGRHARMFGFSDHAVRMVLEWQTAFAKYSPAELWAATDALSQSPPKFPAEHLASIHAAVRELRAVGYRMNQPEERYLGDCMECSGVGFVIVPHAAGMVDGVWKPIRLSRTRATYYTMAVLCDCALGRWKGERLGKYKNGEPRRMMPLHVYEANHPNWREAMSAR